MRSFPLISRELRVQSRARTTYDARVGWGLAAIALLLFLTVNFPNQAANGRFFLSAVHSCLVVMLFLLAPVGTADAISREKREGTLGLLFLTNVTPTQVVLGKLTAHFLRLLYFSLLMLPFLMLPVLLGGVTFQDFLLSSVILLSIAAAGLSAGLLSSALLVNFGASLFCAMIVSALFVLFISAAAVNALFAFFTNRFPDDIPLAFRIFVPGPGLLMFPLQAQEISGTLFPSKWVFPVVELALIILSFLLLILVIRFCARKIAQHAEFSGETKRQIAFRERFLKPVLWKDPFRRMMRRKLDRNPLVWLEYRTAWARAARWAMILIVIAAETALVMTLPNRDDFLNAHFIMICALLIFLTFKSSSSFQREKENGAFELLLVTPFTEKTLVGGRLRAVASYYGLTVLTLAALGLLGFSWTQQRLYTNANPSTEIMFTSIACSIFSVPVCGLFFALRCRTFLPALVWTAIVAILAPICLWSAFNGLLWMANHSQLVWKFALLMDNFLSEFWWSVLLAVTIYHFTVALLCARATLTLLRRRDFGPRA